MGEAARIQERLDGSRARLLAAIELLPDEALTKAGVDGRHSVADLLALQAAWESELVTALMRLDQGKKPGRFLAALAQPDAFEERCLNENRERELDAIFDDYQQVRLQLETWLEDLSDRELTDPKRHKWFNHKPLARVIAETTTDREVECVPRLETFARDWFSREQVSQRSGRRNEL